MNEAPIKVCPACNKSTLVKKVSGAGFILKGTGWYVTDFKDKNNPEKQSSNIGKNNTDIGGEHANHGNHGNHKRGDENKGNDKKEATQEKSSSGDSNKDSAASSNGATTNAVKQTSKGSDKGVTA